LFSPAPSPQSLFYAPSPPQAAITIEELVLFVDAKTALRKQGHIDFIAPDELWDVILRLGLSVCEGPGRQQCLLSNHRPAALLH
jgi:hypothetical protein